MKLDTPLLELHGIGPQFVSKLKRLLEYITLGLLCASCIVLIGLQQKPIGWFLLAITSALLLLCRKEFAKDIFLVVLSVGLLSFTPISADLGYRHVMVMGTMLGLAVLIPYLISRFVYRDHLVRFSFHHGRRWFRSEIIYVLITLVVGYFLLPFYLSNTGAYLNWAVEPNPWYVARFFIGINGVGIWDELFFIGTVLGILRRHFPFMLANFVQATLFTSFLYEFGFTGWGPLMIYPFALIQGLVFKKTSSLFFVITIHLTYDLILFLALLNAHHPTWVPIFLTY